MGFLNGFLGIETKASSGGAVERATSGSVMGGGLISSMLSGSGSAKWDLGKSITEGYERVIWVFRCVDAIASAQATLQMAVVDSSIRTITQSTARIDDPQLTYLLNERPNGYETAWQFRYRVSTQLLLSRKGVFIEIVPAKNGRVGALHLLDPDRVEVVPDPKTFVKEYRIKKGQGNEYDSLKPEQVIWIRSKPHPTKPFEQVTPLMASGLAVETDWLARLYNRTFLSNNGKPGLIVNVRNLMSQSDAEDIKRRFSGGPMMAGQTTVLESDGIDIIDMFSSPQDVQWLQAISGAKEDILLSFGVSESFLGNASGRTFDNADAEFEITWITTVTNHCNSISAACDRLTEQNVATSDQVKADRRKVVYDYSTVEVLQRHEKQRIAALDADFAAGKITHDEWREGCGLEPFNVPASRVVWLPGGKVPFGAQDSDTKAASSLMPVGAGTPVDPSQEAQRGALLGSAVASRALTNIAAARALSIAGRKVLPAIEGQAVREHHDDPEEDDRAGAGPDNEFRALIEGTVEGNLGAWSSRQGDVFVDRLEHVKVRKHTRHDLVKPSTKALDPSYVVEMDRWKADVRRDLTAALTPLAARQARKAALDLDRAGIIGKVNASGKGNPGARSALGRLGVTDEVIANSVLSDVLGMVEQAAERQSQRVADRIKEMDQNGSSLREIKKAVKDMVDARGSWRKGLATHAATALMEGVKHKVYAQAGNSIERKWNTQGDEAVRKSHKQANGQRRLSSKPFRVGGNTLMYPGDPTAPIEETANCRCYLSWSTL